MVRSLFSACKNSWAWSGSAMLLACIFLLLPWASNAATPASGTFKFNIPAATLDEALIKFSEQSGISVGMSGNLPRVMTRPVFGEFRALSALQQLLTGTGLEPLKVGDFSYRLQVRTTFREPDAASPPAKLPAEVPELAEVVVTGTKSEQRLRTVPISMTVIDGTELAQRGAQGGSGGALLHDAATSSTNLGPGRNRQYIRGVADSPFLGPSQATVSVQFDEARVTYDAPDPDLRLLDVEQVEILKGPQGPLYGTGALGGVFRIVPRRPDPGLFQLQAGMQTTDIAGGGTAGGADLMLNAPLVEGKVALRAVAYANTEPGWIDNTDGRSNANDTRIRGARVALRSALPGDWSMDLQGVAQLASSNDSQYLAGAPYPLRRSNILPEPHDNDFYLGSLTAQGRIFGHHALVTASVVSHEADGILDASSAAAAWNVAAPLRYFDDRQYRLANQELRFWSEASAPLGWMIGVSRLSAHSDFSGTLLPANGSSSTVLQQTQHVQEMALFGELGVPLPKQLRTTFGLRAFRSEIENERATTEGHAGAGSVVSAATPSLSLDWRSADTRRFVYLRYARATRPGGLNPAGTEESSRFVADELSNLDLGLRLQSPGDAVSVQGAVFATRWSHIQADFLLPNGLVGTRNAGNGRNLGFELSAIWLAGNRWRFEGGTTLQHARLVGAVPGGPEDTRLPVVPDIRLRATVARSFTLGAWQAELRTDLNYVGAARLSFEAALDRKTPDHTTVDARLGLRLAGLELSLYAANLLNSHADTFAFGNPFSIRSGSQYTPLQPRSLTVGVAYGW